MNLKCSCGGNCRKATLSHFDFSTYAGIPATLVKMPGYRCDKCGGETLGGPTIGRALRAMVQYIVAGQRRLTAESARFLRGRMHMTQQELAAKLGVNRVTVANWEGGEPISQEHDLMLRAMAVAYSVGNAGGTSP